MQAASTVAPWSAWQVRLGWDRGTLLSVAVRARWIWGTAIVVIGCAVAAVIVILARRDVPGVSDMPLAQGIRVVASVEAGGEISSALPGRWQYIALAGPSSTTGRGAIEREVHLLTRDGWTRQETTVQNLNSDVASSRRAQLGTKRSTTQLDDPVRHINVSLQIDDLQPAGDDFPEPLWNSSQIAAAVEHNQPILFVQLSNGPHP
jgi:hypothetical protein